MSPYVRRTESDIARGNVHESATGDTATERYSRRDRTIEHPMQTFDATDARLLYLKFVHETLPSLQLRETVNTRGQAFPDSGGRPHPCGYTVANETIQMS